MMAPFGGCAILPIMHMARHVLRGGPSEIPTTVKLDDRVMWFGPVTPTAHDERTRTLTPTGVACTSCGRRVQVDEQGWVLARTEQLPLPQAYHHLCLFSALGIDTL